MLSFVNAIIIPVSKLVSKFEKWDYKHNQINSELWKIWFGKTVNLLIVVSLQVQRISQTDLIVPNEQIEFNSEKFECREDESSIFLLQLVI